MNGKIRSPIEVVVAHTMRRFPMWVQAWFVGRRSGRETGHSGVPGGSTGGVRDEALECRCTRVLISRTRSSEYVIVARCSAIVARSSITNASRVAATEGITHQNVQ